jgi:hypothetical protein
VEEEEAAVKERLFVATRIKKPQAELPGAFYLRLKGETWLCKNSKAKALPYNESL